MHLKIVFILVLYCNSASSQISESFSDGDFSNNPSWNGTNADFIINTDQNLQLNNTIASSSYLSTAHNLLSLDDKEWRIWTKQSFSSSSSNNGRIYLSADNGDLNLVQNGYYLQLGEAGANDAIRLFKMEAGSSSVICSGSDGQIATSFDVNIKVTLNSGVWTLYSDFDGGTNFNFESSNTDPSVLTGSHFGFLDAYTSSNATKFYYDDIYVGDLIIDTEPPQLIQVNILNVTEIDLLYNEPLDITNSSIASNYGIQPNLGITIASLDNLNSSLAHLTLTSPLQNGITYSVSSNGITDVSGNISGIQSLEFEYLVGEDAIKGDLIITELFVDPTPVIGLPEVEYVEIYNKSDKIFELSDWKLADASSNGTITEGWILPGAYLILVSTSSIDSFNVSNIAAVVSFPSLNNSGDDVKLINPEGIEVDLISYTDDWYQDEIKKSGGYSLERINLDDPCSDVSNWSASISSNGGSPGVENSIYDSNPDNLSPHITSTLALTPNYLAIEYNEGMDSVSFDNASFEFNPLLTISNIYIEAQFSKNIMLSFNEELISSQTYTYSIQGTKDCWLNDGQSIGEFALPETADIGDVVINEILSNPYSGGEDWIEVYNTSSKYIDLFQWQFANFEFDTISNLKSIEKHYILQPDSYALIGEDSLFVLENYMNNESANFIQSDLPSYGNDSSTVILLQGNDVLDFVSYNEDWHLSVIDNLDGVSLERIDPNGDSNDGFNWHSAAQDIGFGTPGLKNSQYIAALYSGDFSFTNSTFSPDNDGFEDVLQINYELQKEGLLGHVEIYDDKGRAIKTLFHNMLLGSSGTFTWDGVKNNDQKGSIGVYVMVFEAFSTDGSVFFTKVKAFTLAGKI